MIKYLTINTVAEISCCVIAFICLFKDEKPAWRRMIIFLFITCFTEFFGIYIKTAHPDHKFYGQYNTWVYNIFTIFEIIFTSSLFLTIFSEYNNLIRRLIFRGGLILFIIYIGETISHGIFKRHELTITVMAVFFVLYSMLYFYYLIKDEQYVQLKYSADFWWVIGVMFFYFGITVCNLFYEGLHHVYFAGSKHSLSYFIYAFLNLLIYVCWAYSFICRKWLTTQRN